MNRKLQFYFWKDRKFIPLDPHEVTLSDTPRSLAWWDKSICMGTKSEYSLYRVIGWYKVSQNFDNERKTLKTNKKTESGQKLLKCTNHYKRDWRLSVALLIISSHVSLIGSGDHVLAAMELKFFTTFMFLDLPWEFESNRIIKRSIFWVLSIKVFVSKNCPRKLSEFWGLVPFQPPPDSSKFTLETNSFTYLVFSFHGPYPNALFWK